MAELIMVRGARDDRRVALFERDPDHPDGEAWVVGDGREHTVALTAAVMQALARGDLVRLVEPAPERPDEVAPSDPEPQPRRRRR